MDLVRAGHVIAGVDGSAQSIRAAEFAAVEAELRGTPLEIIHALPVPIPLPNAVGLPSAGSLVEARTRLNAIVEELRGRHEGLPVAGAVLLGRASDVLVAHSAVGQLVVVGARGSASTERLLLGSVSLTVATHARCPVVVVPEGIDDVRRVVVGTDGSAASAAAVDVAFEEAENRGCPLQVLSAVDPSGYGVSWFWTLVPPISDVRDAAEEVLGREIAGFRRRHPDVEVGTEIVTSRPASALLDRASPDTLVVIGTHGYGNVRGVLLGSVGQNVLHHTTGPTLIVHLPRDRGIDRSEYGLSAPWSPAS